LAPGNRLDRPADEKFDHILGPPDAATTLVEYGSHACRYCRAANARITEVRDRLGDRMRCVFRHRPPIGVELVSRGPRWWSARPIRSASGTSTSS
jgi:Na+:H+ antiporter, NhaA family